MAGRGGAGHYTYRAEFGGNHWELLVGEVVVGLGVNTQLNVCQVLIKKE